MARQLYTLLYYLLLHLLLPLMVLRLLFRSIRAPAYRRRIGERFGRFEAPMLHRPIWIHAVSVGETIAAAPVIRQLQQCHPDRALVVTTMTPTGSMRVRELFGDTVFHVYAPYDLPRAIYRFLDKVRPELLVIMETELWPNLIHCCQQRSIPVVLANARLSEASAAGYRRFSVLTRPMLASLSRVIAQTDADAGRFQSLGLPAQRSRVSGSIKFDITLDEGLRADAVALRQQWGQGRPVWIAASTHEGEDEIVLEAFAGLVRDFPDLLLVLVPRHPERFDRVARLIDQRGFGWQRRSQHPSATGATQVILGDTMGELLLLYGASDMAFVGGSLIDNGGHNMLEPAAWALPIVTGPSDYNFLAISQLLQQKGGLVTIDNAAQMAAQLTLWIESAELRRLTGEAAAKVVSDNRGALQVLMDELEQWVEDEHIAPEHLTPDA